MLGLRDNSVTRELDELRESRSIGEFGQNVGVIGVDLTQFNMIAVEPALTFS